VAAPVGQSLKRLEGKRKPDDDDTERRKRQKKEDGSHQTKFIAARDAQIQKLKEAEQISKRRKLELPAAQVGETELEEIVKMGHAGRAARDLVDTGDETTGRLLDEQEGLMPQRNLRTPRTEQMGKCNVFVSTVSFKHYVIEDNIMLEARNLRNMTAQQTPLLGDENTPLRAPTNGGTGFEGATPRHQVAVTPNPLATPREGVVPGTPLKTPMRDSLRINQEDGYSQVGSTPRERRFAVEQTKRSLRAGFESLPQPENNFELLVPEDEEVEVGVDGQAVTVEDAAERDARERRRRDEILRRELARRSLVIQRSLPRPPTIDVQGLMERLREEGGDDEQEMRVSEEMVKLMEHDSITHPLPGTTRPGSTRSAYEHPDDKYLDQAREAVRRELASMLGFPEAKEEQVKQGVIAVAKDEEVDELWSWAAVRASLAYDAEGERWVDGDGLEDERRKKGLSTLLNEIRERMTREAGRLGKTEKKLGVTLGGYQARSGVLSKRVREAHSEMERTQTELESFERLETNENAAGPRRMRQLEEEIEKLEGRERALQMRYRELEEERGVVAGRVAGLEERLMLEAEALNE
jgi:pre-mRNA-splicing factor CDC5/CEF1